MTKTLMLAGVVAGLFGVCSGAVCAPVLTVSVRTHPVAVGRGGHGTLLVMLNVARGYHVYANKLSDPSMIPTVVTPDAAPGIAFGAPVWYAV